MGNQQTVFYYCYAINRKLPEVFTNSSSDYLSINPISIKDERNKRIYEIYLRDSYGKHVLPSTVTWGLGTPRPMVIFWKTDIVEKLDDQDLQVDRKKAELEKRQKGWEYVCIAARCFSISDCLATFADIMGRTEEHIEQIRKHYETKLSIEKKLNENERASATVQLEKTVAAFAARNDKILKKFVNLGMTIEEFIADKVIGLVGADAEVIREEIGMNEGQEGTPFDENEKEETT